MFFVTSPARRYIRALSPVFSFPTMWRCFTAIGWSKKPFHWLEIHNLSVYWRSRWICQPSLQCTPALCGSRAEEAEREAGSETIELRSRCALCLISAAALSAHTSTTPRCGDFKARKHLYLPDSLHITFELRKNQAGRYDFCRGSRRRTKRLRHGRFLQNR